jgi:hypothetical protein
LTFTAVERAFAIESEQLSTATSPYLIRHGRSLDVSCVGLFRTSEGPSIPLSESALSAYRNPLDITITNIARTLGDMRIYRDFRTGTRDDARIGVSSSGPKRPLEEDGSNLALTLQELDFQGALQDLKRYLNRRSDRFETSRSGPKVGDRNCTSKSAESACSRPPGSPMER